MAGGSPGTLKTDSQAPERREWRPIVTGLVAIVGIALTVLAAFVLAMGQLPVQVQPPEASPVGEQAGPDTPTPTVEIGAPLPSPSGPPPGGTDTPTLMPPAELTATSTPSPTPALVPPTPTAIIIIVTTTPTCRPPNGWLVYTVRSGETLDSIAARYRVNVSLLMEANCLSSPVVYPGQPLFVPPPVVVPTTVVPTTPARPPCEPPQGWVRYTVQPGDTLQSLAQRTNTSVDVLVRANCLTSYDIRPGQPLWLPVYPAPPPPPPPTATFLPPPATPTWTATATFTPTPSPTTAVATPTFTPTPTPSATWTSEPPTPTPTDTPTSAPPPTNTPVPFPTPEGGT
jgi:LysM repeat protein